MTTPPPPSPPTNVPQQVQDHDQAAWVLEDAAVAATAGVIAAEIAAAVLAARRAWRSTYGNHTDRQRDADFRRITADLSTRLQQIDVTPASVILDYADHAHSLGVEQGFEELDLPATPIPSRFDLSTHLAVSRAHLNAQEQIRRSIALVDSLQAGSWRTVENAASTAQQAANTIDRTTTTVFNTELNNGITAAANAFSAQRVWIAERNACLHCLALSGHVVDVGQAFPMDVTFAAKPLTWEPISAGGLSGPPRHPNCLPGDALVLSRSRITGATKRMYNGEMIEVRTLGQKKFTATPNHPVLTQRGWVPIGELREGDYLVSHLSPERALSVADNDQHVPSRIGDIAEAFLCSSDVATAEVPVAPEDFHGDGSGSEVAVVGTYGGLNAVLDPLLIKIVGEQRLMAGHGRRASLDTLRTGYQLLEGSLAPPDGLVGSVGQQLPLLGRRLGHPGEHRLTSIARRNAVLEEYSADGGSGDGKALRERLLRLSGEVSLDEVVEIRRFPFSGHVYNLETEDGWYIGNGIVTHNCRCRCMPWRGHNGPPDTLDFPTALKREAERSVLNGVALPTESPKQRVDAAGRLLELIGDAKNSRSPSGWPVPATVKQRARRATTRGTFTPLAPRRGTPKE